MSMQRTTNLTEGSVSKGMLLFALPIFISNLFQQLYNAADSLIVGNFLGGEALAAVGSSGSLIFLLTGFVNGVSLGAGVVVARYFGAKDWKRLRSNGVQVVDTWTDAYYGAFSGGGDGTKPIVVSYASSPPAEVVFADPPIEKATTASVDSTCFRQVEFAGDDRQRGAARHNDGQRSGAARTV